MSASFAERMFAIVRPPSNISWVTLIVADSLVTVDCEYAAGVARPNAAAGLGPGLLVLPKLVPPLDVPFVYSFPAWAWALTPG